MNDTATLEIDDSRFVHQTVDGEVLLIDFQGGTYYCLRGSVDALWPLIVAGTSRAALADAAAGYFAGPPDSIRESVGQFIDGLAREGILRPATDAAGTIPEANAIATNGEKPLFAPLAIERYDEMRDLLTLDPVHDVTDGGWPNLPR